jgi:lipopolysaccharide biosynthesis protein
LLDSLLLKKGLPKETQAKNYDLNVHNKMTESEILTYFYEDMWHIKNKILELLVEENIKENSNE